MSATNEILNRLQEMPVNEAIFWNSKRISYREFLDLIDLWADRLDDAGVMAGDVCAVYGDYSPNTISIMFALIKRNAIVMPLTGDVDTEMNDMLALAGGGTLFKFFKDDTYELVHHESDHTPALINNFRTREHPGLLVFTSGSTGKPKGILQDVELVCRKFLERRPGWRTIMFLLMDHFGGFNTLISTFAYGGTAVCLADRNPGTVAATIEESRATLLPTTPTFLNYLIVSKQYVDCDLSSIKLISYGTEPMPESTLQTLGELFPNCKLKQTYGLSELGVLRSSSKSNGSLWLKVGGAGFETKVLNGVLWVKSESNMVGYLNAPDPFDEDGWICTNDLVEQDNGYIRFVGRASEVINSGGKKIFPAEVENVLLEIKNVADAIVDGRSHPIMGQVVQARVALISDEPVNAAIERLRTECNKRLATYKVPVRFKIVKDGDLRSARFKKARLPSAPRP